MDHGPSTSHITLLTGKSVHKVLKEADVQSHELYGHFLIKNEGEFKSCLKDGDGLAAD
jgi:hypothetical protein